MSEKRDSQCAKCAVKEPVCTSEEGRGPDFCPTLNQAEVVEKAVGLYDDPETMRFARNASRQEADCYAHRDVRPYVLHPVKPRVQEICEFAWKMGYKKIGVAHCVGLKKEAGIFHEILEAQGFEAVSVCCKVGAVPKERLGLSEEEKIRIGRHETMCNPIAQAEILNEAGCDFNVLIGLCVGHDSLFFKHAQALTTVLVAKDRVTGHNPAAALYTAGSYYARLKRPGIDPQK